MSQIGNLAPLKCASDWTIWLQKFNLFIKANGYQTFADKRKNALMLQFIGDKNLETFNSFNLDEEKITHVELIEEFTKFFVPKQNTTIKRQDLFGRKQQPNEGIEDFLTSIKNLANECDLGEKKNELIKDLFIAGLNGKYRDVKKELLSRDTITLEDLLKVARVVITANKEVDNKPAMEEQQILKVTRGNLNESGFGNKFKTNDRNYQSRDLKTSQSQFNNKNLCTRCGQIHNFVCPARNLMCAYCKKVGHFAKCCFKNKIKTKCVETGENSNDDFDNDNRDSLFVGIVNTPVKKNGWFIDLVINGIEVQVQIDTGAQVSIISLFKLKELNLSQEIIKKSIIRLSTFTNDNVEVLGECHLDCFVQSRFRVIKFIVVNTRCQTILGFGDSLNLGLIAKTFLLNEVKQNKNIESGTVGFVLDELVSSYNDLFEGLGTLPVKANIVVDPSVRPVIEPPRRIPFNLQESLRLELESMCKNKVITKVVNPTKWVSSIVLVCKPNNKIRVCLDPRNLNKAVLRSHYPIPDIEIIRSKLNGAHIFSSLDAFSGFWMVPLDEESSHLCTFNTPFGRYRFLKLPYGICSAPEIFHRIMCEIFGDLPGTIIYIDDILVFGKTELEHYENLARVFEKAKSVGLKLNRTKCKFGRSEISYVGHIFNNQGMSADPSKIEAILKIPTPKDKKDLQKFLGMANYLGIFVDNLSNKTKDLRQLLTKNSDFVWDENYEQSFNALKQAISAVPILTYFDPNKTVVLSVDSSQFALGAVILQDGKPLAFSSKSLTDTQQRYAQIEKELLAIVFGCEKFHQYLYGQVVQVETDHQPLVTLFKKSLHQVPVRLQRMMLRIQKYDVRVNYYPGKSLVIADTLSRLPLLNSEDCEMDDDLRLCINIVSDLSLSDVQLRQLKDAVAQDSTLQLLIKYSTDNWPESKNYVPESVKPYYSIRDEICLLDGLVLKGQNIIIPYSLRKEMLSKIHESHLGIEKCLRLARDLMYWPNMSSDIKNVVQQCDTCMKYSTNNAKQPLIPHSIPSLPFEKVGVDFFSFKSKTYLILIDYFSKYVETVQLMSGYSASQVIIQLKSIFARHGIPVELISDNGPPFNSEQFQSFFHSWGINHVTSSPHHPKSNGLVENAVKTIKNMLYKCEEEDGDPYIGLLHLRTTPKGNLYSPAELLMSRRLRTKLPTHSDRMKPTVVDVERLKQLNLENQNKMRYNHDKTAGNILSNLNVDQLVYFKKDPNSVWIKGKVIEILKDLPRSYKILSEDNVVYRRNRFLIKERFEGNNLDDTENNNNKQNDRKIFKEVDDNNSNKLRQKSSRMIRKPSKLNL